MAFQLAKWMAVSGALLAVAGCGAFSEKQAGPCPVVVAVDDAARLTKFAPGGSDLTEVLFEVTIEDVQYACNYDGPILEMVVTLTLVGTEGPANVSGTGAFNYFVAVATNEREILAREDFDVTMPFQGNATRVRLTETVEPAIPLNPGETGEDFRLFVGFDLTEAELQYNRARR